MKKILFFLMAIWLISACETEPEKFTVLGELQNGEGQYLYLLKLETNNYIPIDSVMLKPDGKFSFSGQTDAPSFYVIRTNPQNFIYLIIDNKENIAVRGDLVNIGSTYTVEGSKDSKLLKEIRYSMDTTLRALDSIALQLKESMALHNFKSIEEELKAKSLAIFNNQKDFLRQFIKNNSNSLASMIALYQQIGPKVYVLDYKEEFEYYELVDSSLFALYPEYEPVKTFHSQVEEIKRQRKSETRLDFGSVAPEISLPTPDGDTINLSSLKGKYVLLDFWASWCSPCRRENPVLVKNYEKYNPKGFEIYQVSLDKKRESWVKAIEKDNLHWTHVSDLQYWNSTPAKLYNISGIPANFLLDPEGKIIAKNLRGDALEAKLSEIFD